MTENAFGIIDGFRLDGKVSLVTGASRGLGLAIAEGLAGAGSDLVINGRVRETLEEVAASIGEKAGRKVMIADGDIADMDFVRGVVPRIVEEMGHIDVLVNNAGINIRGDSAEYPEEDWDTVTGINLKAAFFLSQECGKAMIERGEGGKVINILSLASSIGLPGIPAYAAAKGGLTMVTKTLAVEWAPNNIQVNGIGPGFFATSLTEPLRQDFRNNWILRRIPTRQWGKPMELAGAAIFLASPASNYVTGQVLYVDGGFLTGTDWRKQED
ncbi:MAG: glucose 1-dehydrogenase [Planctomycetota bacterium]|jgi:NAD(P)-dependent dehydrogenase (short-subunit alcohol dehydrogenase family)|nr:glucose 1-dehydrogenase [Planctomycetota bacterium]